MEIIEIIRSVRTGDYNTAIHQVVRSGMDLKDILLFITLIKILKKVDK